MDTLTWSSQWLGFRRWAVDNGLYIRIDNLGGSSGLIVRPDGEPLFLQNEVQGLLRIYCVHNVQTEESQPLFYHATVGIMKVAIYGNHVRS